MPPTISTAVVDQQALGIWFDRIKDIVQLVTVKTNPTGGGPGSPNPTLQVSVSDAAVAVQTINLSDLIQQDQYAPNGLSVVRSLTSRLSKSMPVPKLPSIKAPWSGPGASILLTPD